MMIVDTHVFFIKSPQTCLWGAYKCFGVKRKTYAASVVERIYDYYCRGAVNLYWTYIRYYRKEFSTYNEYLNKKFNLFPNEIGKLSSKLLYYKDITFQPESNITNLMEESAMTNMLKKFWGEEVDED